MTQTGRMPEGHMVHGMGMALEAPAWPAITPAEAGAVLARFPASAGRPFTLAWHSPRPFSAAVRVEVPEGTFFLKRHHARLRSPATLAPEHAFMAHLHARGLPVPLVETTHDGASVLAQGDWTYELLRPVPGADLYRDRQSWTPFLKACHAPAAGAALARLHLAARDFRAPARPDCPLVGSFTILPAPDPMAAARAYVAARPALAGWLEDKGWQSRLAALFTALGTAMADPPAMPSPLQRPLWTHNDWHPSNLLWADDNTVAGIIDFGLATQTSALHDLATAIERCAIPWLDLASADPAACAQAALGLIAGYRSLVPLSGGDLARVIALLPLVHIEFALSEVDYFIGILNDEAQAMIAWDDYLLGHAQWFLSDAGRAFLGALEQGAQA